MLAKEVGWFMAALLSSALGLGSWTSEEHTLDTSGIRRVEVRGFDGFIHLKSGAEIPKIQIGKRGDVLVTVEKRGDLLYIEGKQRTRLCQGCGVRFDLSLPAGLTYDLKTSNGEIVVGGRVQALTAQTSNGTVQVNDSGQADLTLSSSNAGIAVDKASGRVQVSTSNGKVSLTNVQGDVSASTSNNLLEVANVRGQVRLETSNGGIRVKDVQGEIWAKTNNAPLRLEQVTFLAGSHSRVESSNGPIEVIAPSSAGGLNLSGKTSNGGISINLSGFEVQTSRHSFSALKPGPNPAVLEVVTSNGNLTLH